MKRLYFHPQAIWRDSNWVCSYCQRILPNGDLKQPFPCSVPTASEIVGEAGVWTISVWNCRPKILLDDKIVKIEPDVWEKLLPLVVEAVYKEGALNISGIYSVPDALVRKLDRFYAEGKIRRR